MYQPKPIDTLRIQLPGAITALIERLAEHNHDIWAQQRMREGWTYGPQRDDAKKLHLDLVPYDQLPESEKELRPQDGNQHPQADRGAGISDRTSLIPRWCATASDCTRLSQNGGRSRAPIR